jgi:predicted GNAT family N-acyltransferase
LTLHVKPIETPEELEQAFAIRRKVFIEEQNIPEELEMDEWDDAATHFLAFHDGEPIGTCRARWLNDQTIKAERVAVLKQKRKVGAGKLLMQTLEEFARQKKAQAIYLNAQTQVVPFYKRLGYKECGAPFDEAGIPHVPMMKELI